VMTIYDVDMPVKQARQAVTYHFRKHSELKDGRVVGLLLAKGYMELEETLMQWKQKTHLLRVLDPMELRRNAMSQMSSREKFILGIEDDEKDELL
jgi:NADH dehydrogenase (ubiquinone) 1 alpha subcomplex subunit 6